MLRSAIVGVGFMGWIHYLAYQRSKHIQLAGFASRDAKKRAGDWTSIQGNFGPPGEQIDTTDLAVFDSIESLLADETIDVVDICLPPSLHTEVACQALKAGKHVICEKPLALDVAGCDQILQTAKQHDRHVTVAQVLPFMGDFAKIYNVASGNELGEAKRAFFKRIISPPTWIPDFYDPNSVGGPVLDLHVHDMHLVRLLYGMPNRVYCSAELHEGVVKFCQTILEFDDPTKAVTTMSGVSDQTARSFCHGCEIHFERGALSFELGVVPDGVDILPLKVFDTAGNATIPELPTDPDIELKGDDVDSFRDELDTAAASILSGEIDPRIDVTAARDAIAICHALEQSAKLKDWVAL